MTDVKVTAKDDTKMEMQYDFGSDLDDAVSRFGAEVVYDMYKQRAVVALQDQMRRLLNSGKDPAAVKATLAEWKPGVRIRTRKSPVEKVKGLMNELSPEQLEELRRTLAE